MENAADALKMAAAVLIFVAALSISINAFSQASTAVTTILQNGDREYDYTYVEDNGTTERIVGLETIIPSIYRIYSENYKIVFDSSILPEGVYKDKNGNPINNIELKNVQKGKYSETEKVLNSIIYGDSYEEFDYAKSLMIGSNTSNALYLNSDGIYDILKEVKVVEKLGVYYQEEVTENEEESSGSSTPNVNKTPKRVITYTKAQQ